MSLDIKPGSKIKIKVTKNPTSQRAAKTLSRLFLRDAGNQKLARRRHRILAETTDPRRRGGRLWNVKSKAPRLVQPRVGATCSITATVDMLATIQSVSRFIAIESA